jgi:hypothetical protein
MKEVESAPSVQIHYTPELIKFINDDLLAEYEENYE